MLLSKFKIFILMFAFLFTMSLSSFSQREDLRKDAFGKTQYAALTINKFKHLYISSNNADVFLTEDPEDEFMVDKQMLSLEDVNIHQSHDTLYISNKGLSRLNRFNIYLNVSTLESIEVVGKTNVYSMNKIAVKNLSLIAKQEGAIKLAINADDVNINVSNDSVVELKGNSDTIEILKSSDSKVKVNRLVSNEVRMIDNTEEQSMVCLK